MENKLTREGYDSAPCPPPQPLLYVISYPQCKAATTLKCLSTNIN